MTIPAGALRFNSDSGKLEYYNGEDWWQIDNFSADNATGGARGLFMGGETPSPVLHVNTIDYVTISTTGNALDFGDLTTPKTFGGASSSSTRGIHGGAWTPSNSNVIDYVTISSTGNAADFGDLITARELSFNQPSSSTRGLFAGGASGPSPVVFYNVIEYVTIASTGNTKDFGDLSAAKYGNSGCSSSTRGLWAGGASPSTNVIEFVTISTLGNASDFGDLLSAKAYTGSCSNSTRGLWAGSGSVDNVIQFVTISTLGNATDFGDLTRTTSSSPSCSSPTRGLWGGGANPGYLNIIDYVSIMSTGNAVDFGDLTQPRFAAGACSNAHGGL